MISICVGLIICTLFGPRSTTSYYTIEDILYKFSENSSSLIIIILSCFVFINWAILQIECKYKTDEFYMLTYVHISSYFGSWNILLTKCLLEIIASSLISMQYASLNWTHWLSYILVIAFILSFIGVENWKQKAFDRYHIRYGIAIHTFLFIIIGIILGSMLFDEFTNMTLIYVIIYFISILISFIGVGMVSFNLYPNDDGIETKEPFKQWTYKQDNIEMINDSHSDEKLNEHFIINYTEGNSHEPESSKRQGMIDWNHNQLNWQLIGQILMDHEFIDTVEATNATLDHLV